MKEANVLALLERRLKALGPDCVFVKIHGSPLQPAALDLIGSYRGIAWTVETKRPGGKPTPRQKALLERWNRAGALTWVVDSALAADQFVGFLKAIVEDRMRHAS